MSDPSSNDPKLKLTIYDVVTAANLAADSCRVIDSGIVGAESIVGNNLRTIHRLMRTIITRHGDRSILPPPPDKKA